MVVVAIPAIETINVILPTGGIIIAEATITAGKGGGERSAMTKKREEDRNVGMKSDTTGNKEEGTSIPIGTEETSVTKDGGIAIDPRVGTAKRKMGCKKGTAGVSERIGYINGTTEVILREVTKQGRMVCGEDTIRTTTALIATTGDGQDMNEATTMPTTGPQTIEIAMDRDRMTLIGEAGRKTGRSFLLRIFPQTRPVLKPMNAATAPRRSETPKSRSGPSWSLPSLTAGLLSTHLNRMTGEAQKGSQRTSFADGIFLPLSTLQAVTHPAVSRRCQSTYRWYRAPNLNDTFNTTTLPLRQSTSLLRHSRLCLLHSLSSVLLYPL